MTTSMLDVILTEELLTRWLRLHVPHHTMMPASQIGLLLPVQTDDYAEKSDAAHGRC